MRDRTRIDLYILMIYIVAGTRQLATELPEPQSVTMTQKQ